MPLFDFTCTVCGNKTELIMSVAEADAGTYCPSCDAPMERELSLVSCAPKSGSTCVPTGGGFS